MIQSPHMRKIVFFCLLLMIISLVSNSAMVRIIFNPNVNIPPTTNGIPVTHLKFYYGAQLQTYTNYVVWSLDNNITNTVPISVYDPVGCVIFTRECYVIVPVYGLELGQQFYYGYIAINSNGQESPIIAQSICGFIVTNVLDKPVSPMNLRLQ